MKTEPIIYGQGQTRPNRAYRIRLLTHWFWRITLLLATYLHLHYHLPHRGCILLLKIFRLIFVSLHMLEVDEKVPITLTTTFSCLGLQDNFEIHAMCPGCRCVYAHELAPLYCVCGRSLFEDTSSPNRKPKSAKPSLQFPQRLLSASLPAFFNRLGIEDAIDEWRNYTSEPGKLKTVMDGNIWKTIKGHDGKLFFDNSPDRADPDELRI